MTEDSQTYYAGLMRRFGTAAMARRMRFNPSIRSIAKDVVVLHQSEDDITSQISDQELQAFMNRPSTQGVINAAQAQQPVEQEPQWAKNMSKKIDQNHRSLNKLHRRVDAVENPPPVV